MQTMIITNLKISIRNILKNKSQTLISIFGLGIGLGCVFLLMLLFIHENSFDRFIPNHKDVYRVIQGNDCRTPFPLAKSAKDEFPAIENYFRYYETPNLELKNTNNEILSDVGLACADASVFNCLGIPFINGHPAGSKTEIAISENIAKKYFGKANPVGQSLQVRLLDQFIPLSISGVYKNFPTNSSLNANFVADLEFTDEVLGKNKRLLGQYGNGSDGFRSNWNFNILSTYFRLNEKSNVGELEKGIQKYREQVTDSIKKQMVYSLQPVSDIYLKSGDIVGNAYTKQANATELKYYVAIAILILFIAIINYIFQTKAKIETRLKEIGAKKALGASRSSLLKQVILEANIISIISLLPASMVVVFGIPFINDTLGRNLDPSVFTMWQTWPILILLVLLTGILSGIFIGLNISRVSPVLLLRAKTTQGPRFRAYSNSFLSLHFAIFILLIVGVITVKKQINYALTNFQAINTENILICELNSAELSNKFDVIKNEIDKLPGVVKTAGTSFIPPFNNFLPLKLASPDGKINQFDGLIMGQGMVELLGLELLDGESFGNFRTDGGVDVILNESAAKKYNVKAGDMFMNVFFVKGIVRDFNGHSLHKLIQPMAILQQNPQRMRLFAIKTDGKSDALITTEVHKLFKQISPDKNVNTYSLTEQINTFYTQEENQAKLISAFSLLAMVLSIMGLLGMTLNTISKKTKEIGIRKVNGAKVSEVLGMLNLVFIKWIVVAIIVATPLSYFAVQKWLENFAYKTTLSWWIFALAGLLALGIALLTVSWQSWKAASRNPVEALRYE